MEAQAEEKESRQRELEYALKFVEWLKSLGMIDESTQKKKETPETGLAPAEQENEEKEQKENEDINEDNNEEEKEENAAIVLEEE